MVVLLIILVAILCIYIGQHLKIERNKKWWQNNINQNFAMTWKGKVVWRSRSVAVVGFTFCKNEKGEWCVLANKRGKGTPDFQGMWNVPCGYLDYGENGETAVTREIYEETGLSFLSTDYKMWKVDTDPKSNLQNVSIRYINIISDKNIESLSDFSTNNSEENEVDGIKWIKLSELDNFMWAFNHKDLIQEVFQEKIKQ